MTKFSTKKVYKALLCRNIVSYDEFKIFIENQNILYKDTYTPKQLIYIINRIIKEHENKFKTYKDPSSNIQFLTVSTSKYFIEPLLIELLNDFLDNMHCEFIFTMIKYNKNDNEILDFIKLNYTPMNRVYDTLQDLHKIANTITYNLKHIENKIKILDVGEGNDKKIKKIKEYIIRDCEIYETYIPFQLTKLNPYKIPYPDKTFDCITIMLVLHHIDDIVTTINECYRILKDDGIIILVEHDVWNDKQRMLIDIQHRIYQTIHDAQNLSCSMYYNYYEWDIIFNKCNMKLVTGYRLTNAPVYKLRYDVQIIHVYRKNI